MQLISTRTRLAVVAVLAGIIGALGTSAARAFTVNHTFQQTPALGSFGPASLVLAPNGTMYGATRSYLDIPEEAGGLYGCGAVYAVSPSGDNSIVHSFTPVTPNYTTGTQEYENADGALPFAAPVVGSDGNLYGTTASGGADGYGGLYKVDPATNQFSFEFSFTGTSGSYPGINPSVLVAGPGGILYGITIGSDLYGAPGGEFSNGSVFEFVPGTGVFTNLLNFMGATGASIGSAPEDLILASDGNLFGTTHLSSGAPGGGFSYPEVFEVNLESDAFSYTSFPDGPIPDTIVQAPNGLIYGTALSEDPSSTSGTVFSLDPSTLAVTNLGLISGSTVSAGLIEAPVPNIFVGKGGNVYGFTSNGGANSDGTLFKVTTSTNAFSIVTNFGGVGGSSPGGFPDALATNPTGRVYGQTLT